MKIAFLITYFSPDSGGAENNCFSLAKSLAKKHEIHIFCSGKKSSQEIINNVTVHNHRELFRIKYYLAAYPTITKSLSSQKFDIIHVHGLGFMQHDRAIKHVLRRYPETKIVCTPHGPFMALKKYPSLLGIAKNLYIPILKKNLEDYSLFIQVNPNQHKWMESDYGISSKKIKFLPNGIDKSSFKNVGKSKFEKSLENRFVISYLGRIQNYKGLDQIIKSLPKIKIQLPEVLFVAMGQDSGDKARLTRLAENLGVSRNVLFTGKVSEEEKLSILDASEIFIFPSQWEAFGIVMLEAMARGNAIVSTRTEGGNYLIKEDNGLLFDYQNLSQLQGILTKLIKDKKLRKSMQNKNKKKAKQYLWSKISKDLENYYRELLNGK